jgi:hypothetical protein
MNCVSHSRLTNFLVLVFLTLYKIMSIEIKLRKGEPMDRAIRRLKKSLDREGVIRDVRAKRYRQEEKSS